MDKKLYYKNYYEKNKHKWIEYRNTQLNDPNKKKALRHSQKIYARKNYKPIIKKHKKTDQILMDKKTEKTIEIIDTFISFENYKKYLNL